MITPLQQSLTPLGKGAGLPPFPITAGFAGANGTALNGLTTDTGNKVWTAAANFTLNGSSRLAHSTSSDDTAYVDAGVSDCTVQATMFIVAGNPSLMFRYTDGNNFWVVIGAGTTLLLFKKVTGGFNQTDSGTFASGDILKVTLSGNVITVYRNGSLVITRPDSFNSTATKHGLRSNGTNVTWDDFSISVP